MIVGSISNWTDHMAGQVWEEAFEFIRSLNADSPEGESIIDGSNVFARIMSYSTREPESGILESHCKYIDIQSSIVNAERIDWFAADSLKEKAPYDPVKDVILYERPGLAPARVDVSPGMFVVLYPEDAHMPQLLVGGSVRTVKKVVVKIRVSYVQRIVETAKS